MTKKAWGSAVRNREELFELKRQAVLHTAARMIQRRGYEQTSLADIADELSIGKTTIFYYFQSKAEIVRELLRIGVEVFLDPAVHPEDYPQVPGLNGAQRMERFLRRCVRNLCIDTGGCLLTTPREVLDSDTRAQFHIRSRAVDDMGRAILRDGIADGSIGACDVPTTYAMIGGALRHIPTLHESHKNSAAELADSAVYLLMRGLQL